MLYTGKGDDGTTGLFVDPGKKRYTKGSLVFHALGSTDKLNSFLGLCAVYAKREADISIGSTTLYEVVRSVQENLFIVQAEIAGSDKKISSGKTKEMEGVIHKIDEELPEIKTFVVPGGTELSAMLDVARTIARESERRIIQAIESESLSIGKDARAYMNRLSSLLYACARLVNHKKKVQETPPRY